MLEKLKEIEKKYNELSEKLLDPNVFSDPKNYAKLAKEHSDMGEIVEKSKELQKLQADNDFAKESLSIETDPEMKAMFEEEFYSSKEKIKELENEIKLLLLGKDEDDEKNVIMEIRGGAGGEEAALFAAELMRMYQLFSEKNRLTFEIVDLNDTELGGVKEATIRIVGKDAYSLLKFESGVHRVQRVPDTESQGRVHTSTVTVAVLPEHTDVEIEINDKDLQVDTYRSGGAGGQHVNKTESAIRITHLPTGIVVTCQDERSQIKNREKAMNILKSKLYDYFQSQIDAEYAQKRKNQVGTGDRSEKIRTYNFPQNRVTDHRVNVSIYSLEDFMNGELMPIIEPLKLAEQAARLAAAE